MPDGTVSRTVDHEKDTPTIDDRAWSALGRVLLKMIVVSSYRPVDENGNPMQDGSIEKLSDFLNEEARKILRTEGNLVNLPILFPERMKNFRIEQATDDTFVLRFPWEEVAKAGRDRVSSGDGGSDEDVVYREPPFYKFKVNADSTDLTNLNFFHARVCDYTMSMCK